MGRGEIVKYSGWLAVDKIGSKQKESSEWENLSFAQRWARMAQRDE